MAIKENKLLKWILLISVFLNIGAAAYFGKKLYNKYSSTPVASQPVPNYYVARTKIFDVLPKDSNMIVFLGDSHTEYFELGEFLQNPQVKNRGIHGDMMPGVMARLSQIISLQPKKIFIEIGINDLEQKVTEKEFLKQYEKMVDTLQISCPQAKIYVQSLLPVSNQSTITPGYCSPAMNEKIIQVNRHLKTLAGNRNCSYIDVHNQLALNGEINPAYTFEGLHLSADGYAAWTKVLKPYVLE